MLSNNIAAIATILETYEGRDKVLKCLSYVSKLATLFTESSETSRKCIIFGSKMSECRVILRLMDDIPILHAAFLYARYKKEQDGGMRALQLMRISLEALASPVEHICWAAEHRLVAADTNYWDLLSTRLWVLCLCVSLWISGKRLSQLQSKDGIGFCDTELEMQIKVQELIIMNRQRRDQLLTCLRLALDLSYALSYLPSVRQRIALKTWQVGLLGSLSSLIGISQLFLKTTHR